MSLRTMVLLVLAAVAHALPVQNQMAAATAEAAATMVATATAATTTATAATAEASAAATAATAEASAAAAATVDAAVATMDEAAATAATATEPLTATFAMASDAASDAAASVGFDSIEDFFSFVEEQESSPVPTPDKDLTCVSDASDTHCIIHSLDGYHAALKKTIHSPESQCKPGLFTLSQPLHNLNIDSRPHHPASLGQGIVTFQAGAEHTEFGYGSQGVKFPKDSHPLYRETQGEQAHETGMKTGSVAMMWDAGSLNMDFLNNVRNDPQGVGCCGVHSLANCACVILGAYGLESFKSTDGGLVSGSCKGNVWNTLFEYNRSAVEDVVGQKFKPYLVNETKAKVMNENVTAFELMKDTFPQVFNEGQKCDSGNHACPCQNLTHPPWWNGESESGKALLEAAKHWFNGVEQGPNQDSWTNAFVDNEESHSVFAMHRKVVGTLFPGGLGNGTPKDRAFEQGGEFDEHGQHLDV